MSNYLNIEGRPTITPKFIRLRQNLGKDAVGINQIVGPHSVYYSERMSNYLNIEGRALIPPRIIPGFFPRFGKRITFRFILRKNSK